MTRLVTLYTTAHEGWWKIKKSKSDNQKHPVKLIPDVCVASGPGGASQHPPADGAALEPDLERPRRLLLLVGLAVVLDGLRGSKT